MKLEKYAQLLIHAGLNVKEGQVVVIRTPVEVYEFVQMLVDECFKAKAKDVIVKYNDEIVSHSRYLHADSSVFESVPSYVSDFYNQTAEKGACYLTLVGDDPDLMKDVDSSLMMSYSKAFRKATKSYRNKLDFMECQWCIGAVSTKAWASKVYPDLKTKEAVDALWNSIFSICRIDKNNPIDNWQNHRKSFEKRVSILNSLDIDYFKYYNSIGTNLTVKMPEGYLFCGGGSYLNDGTYYFPNIPTEEVFSMPYKYGVNGHLVASKPLVYNGNLIDDFSFDFKDGKVISFHAKKGQDVLQSILEADEGSSYLGEIALVPFDSPISKMDTLFYETLIDENASCHFALGQSYNECIQDGLKQDEATLLSRGANQSLMHVDFMVGTSDLTIDAYTKNGKKVSIFKEGKFSEEFD